MCLFVLFFRWGDLKLVIGNVVFGLEIELLGIGYCIEWFLFIEVLVLVLYLLIYDLFKLGKFFCRKKMSSILFLGWLWDWNEINVYKVLF